MSGNAPQHHPPREWLQLRKTGDLPRLVALIVDCHRSVCEPCDKASCAVPTETMFDPSLTSTRIPPVLAEWLEDAPTNQWTASGDGVERMALCDGSEARAWLERRAPTGQDGGWNGTTGTLGLVLAGAVSVDGSRRARGDVLASCTQASVVRVVSATPVIFVRTSGPGKTST